MSAMIEAFMIVSGDIVDLEGDKYADPDNDNVRFQSEYMEVVYVEDQETPRCVVIGFGGFDHVGFPLYHKLKVVSLNGQRRSAKHG